MRGRRRRRWSRASSSAPVEGLSERIWGFRERAVVCGTHVASADARVFHVDDYVVGALDFGNGAVFILDLAWFLEDKREILLDLVLAAINRRFDGH